MSNLTPGKWFTDPDFGNERVVDERGVLIADCSVGALYQDVDADRCRCNAKIISLVPDMIAFIKGRQSQPGHYCGCTNPHTPCTSACAEAVRILKELEDSL